MTSNHFTAASALGLAVGLLVFTLPSQGHAAMPGLMTAAVPPPHVRGLLPVAEKKSDKASQQQRTTTKKAEPAKKATTTQKKTTTGGSSSSGSGGNTGGGSASKTGGTGDRNTQPSTGSGGLQIGTPSKSKTAPETKSGDVATKDRGTGSTAGKSLDDLLGSKTKTKDGGLPTKEESPILGAPAAEDGTTYTTQQVTQEELEQYAEEHPDELSDSDGDGVYESTMPLDDEANVVIEDGKAYIDQDGDGEFDHVISADYYDAESNTITLPVTADNYIIGENWDGEPYGGIDGSTDGANGAIFADLDGDGVDEIYTGYDSDGDGIADVVSPDPLDLGGAGMTEEEFRLAVESGEIKQFEYPDFGQETAEDNGDNTGQRPRVNVGLSLAPTPAPAAATATTAGTMGGNALVTSLQQLKMLREQGVLSAVEHDNAQLRALADVNAQQTGIENGLALLRQLWEGDLITQSPYARKRQELLDAL